MTFIEWLWIGFWLEVGKLLGLLVLLLAAAAFLGRKE